MLGLRCIVYVHVGLVYIQSAYKHHIEHKKNRHNYNIMILRNKMEALTFPNIYFCIKSSLALNKSQVCSLHMILNKHPSCPQYSGLYSSTYLYVNYIYIMMFVSGSYANLSQSL